VPTLGTRPIAVTVLKVAYSLRAACVRELETPRMTLRAQPAIDTGDRGARPARLPHVCLFRHAPRSSRMSPTTSTPIATNSNRGSRSVKLALVEHAMQVLRAVSDRPTPTPYGTTAL
jgi:hypothetical protein